MMCPHPKTSCILFYMAIIHSPAFQSSVTVLLQFFNPLPQRWLDYICAVKWSISNSCTCIHLRYKMCLLVKKDSSPWYLYTNMSMRYSKRTKTTTKFKPALQEKEGDSLRVGLWSGWLGEWSSKQRDEIRVSPPKKVKIWSPLVGSCLLSLYALMICLGIFCFVSCLWLLVS